MRYYYGLTVAGWGVRPCILPLPSTSWFIPDTDIRDTKRGRTAHSAPTYRQLRYSKQHSKHSKQYLRSGVFNFPISDRNNADPVVDHSWNQAFRHLTDEMWRDNFSSPEYDGWTWKKWENRTLFLTLALILWKRLWLVVYCDSEGDWY